MGILPLARRGEWDAVFTLLQKEPYASRPDLVRSIADTDSVGGLLHMAVMQGVGAAARRLIQDFGLDKNGINGHGQTPLALACASNKMLCVCELLAHGCDANAVDRRGHGPLYHAVSGGYIEIVQLLVQAKANTSFEDADGVSSLERARRCKHSAIVNFLTEEQLSDTKEAPCENASSNHQEQARREEET